MNLSNYRGTVLALFLVQTIVAFPLNYMNSNLKYSFLGTIDAKLNFNKYESTTQYPEPACTEFGGTISTVNNTNNLLICVGDGENNWIDVNLTQNFSIYSYWLITDSHGNIFSKPSSFPFNFEGFEEGTYYIQHLSSNDEITTFLDIGDNIANIQGCHDFSNRITITAIKEGNCDISIPEMIFVEGGTFRMGCNEDKESTCDSDEFPNHEVEVNSFYLGTFEVTQQDWINVFGENPSEFQECGNLCPVEMVTWYHAAVYCNRLSEMAGLTPCYYRNAGFTNVYGKLGNQWTTPLPNSGSVFWNTSADGYRLPTEAEWEFAARGGNLSNGFVYAGSDNLDLVGWFSDNSDATPHEVGQKMANELGFFDITGNVWEWCWDLKDDTYYESSPNCSPTGPQSGEYRIQRGGCWNRTMQLQRISNRGQNFPNLTTNNYGLRLARGTIKPDICNTDCNRKVDSLILVNLFEKLDGLNWTYDDTEFNNGEQSVPIPNAGTPWNFNQPIDSWHGVQTDENGCVIGLALRSNGLRGTLPPEIGSFSTLKNLMLNNNSIIGAIPKELGNLTELKILRLFNNQLTDSIPSELGNLLNLTRLTLESNQLTGSLPSELGSLTKLEILRLKNNNLTGPVPNSFSQLSKLEKLIISNNQLSGPIPKGLGNLANLSSLYFHNNNFTGCFPEALKNFCDLGLSNNDQNDGYNFTNNKDLLPNEGDFDLFCSIGEISCCQEFRVLVEETNSPNCSNSQDGSISFSVENGSGNYSFNWKTGTENGNGQGLEILNLFEGNYQITLTDNIIGCEKTFEVTIESILDISLNCIESETVSTVGGSNGVGIVEIMNGQPPFKIDWNGPSSGTLSNGILGLNTISGLKSGVYNISVEDGNQCIQSCQFNIKQIDTCIEDLVIDTQPEQSIYEYCSSTTIPTLKIIPQNGYQYNWYNLSGQRLIANQTYYQPDTPGSYFVETVRISDECKSQDLVEIRVIENQPPTISLDKIVCNSDLLGTYIARLTINNASEVSFDNGQFRNTGDVYTVYNIFNNEVLTITATSTKNCTIVQRFESPDCDCPYIPPPTINNPEVFFCPSDGFPAIQAQVEQGFTVDWYDAPSAGRILAENQLSLNTDGQGIYYAEARSNSGICRSLERTRVLVFELDQPFIKDIDKYCDDSHQNYTLIFEALEADEVTTSVGNLRQLSENLFQVDSIWINQPTIVTAIKTNTECSLEFVSLPPDCICDSLPPPIFREVQQIQTYCSNEETPEITATTTRNNTVNWYDAPQGGNLIAKSQLVFRPEAPGKYYAETVSRDGKCLSNKRTGIQIKKLKISQIETLESTCLIGEIRSDTTHLRRANGCDSLVITKYFMEEMPEEVFDTTFVCSPEKEGVLSSFETVNNCTIIRTTTQILKDIDILANAGADDSFCEKVESIQLFANLPDGTTGKWVSLDGAQIENERLPETIAIITSEGYSRFIWVLSTETCENIARDTVTYWIPETFSTSDDEYDLNQNKPLNNANLLTNDDLPKRFDFAPFDYPHNEPISFNQNNGKLDGTFSYNTGSEPASISFHYKVCDTECIEICDTSKVIINVDCLIDYDHEIPNGFDPYLGELFDPLSYLINKNCDQSVLLEESSLEIYDNLGNLVFKGKPYKPWDGKSTNGKFILPMDNYYWKMVLEIKANQNHNTSIKEGVILLFHN